MITNNIIHALGLTAAVQAFVKKSDSPMATQF